MAEVKKIDYYGDYEVIRPSLFRESSNLSTIMEVIHESCYQQQEVFIWLSQNILNLDIAQKSHLDFIGSIIGQPRFLIDFNTDPYFGFEGSYQSETFGSKLDPSVGGYWNSRSYFNTATSRKLNDDEYRNIIRARAIANQSNCTIPDLVEVVNLITGRTDNTVQAMGHGLIRISSADETGFLSYFIDRVYSSDNILPIPAGVRVEINSLT